MEITTLILIGVVALLVAGFVQRFRARAAMGRTWTAETELADAALEDTIRSALRGMLPGRIHGTVREGRMRRTIRRWAVNWSSRATVSVSISDRASHGCRTVSVELTDGEAETFFGMVHPAWCAPLAAQRRAHAVYRKLVDTTPNRDAGA